MQSCTPINCRPLPKPACSPAQEVRFHSTKILANKQTPTCGRDQHVATAHIGWAPLAACFIANLSINARACNPRSEVHWERPGGPKTDKISNSHPNSCAVVPTVVRALHYSARNCSEGRIFEAQNIKQLWEVGGKKFCWRLYIRIQTSHAAWSGRIYDGNNPSLAYLCTENK